LWQQKIQYWQFVILNINAFEILTPLRKALQHKSATQVKPYAYPNAWLQMWLKKNRPICFLQISIAD
jgi:hypothetical protein